MRRNIKGFNIEIMDKWIRETLNPYAPKYPRSGDFIRLKGHKLLLDGEYLVTGINEFEPPFHKDEDGRDIRVALTNGEIEKREMNGVQIRKAMERSRY